jgi:hypothetical protein
VPLSDHANAGRRFVVQLVWVLWTGAAAALQSEQYGNVGPTVTWDSVGSYPDEDACKASRDQAVDQLLQSDPGAVKRKEDLVASKRPMPAGDGTIHTVTKFLCLPEGVDPQKSPEENAAALEQRDGAVIPQTPPEAE